MTEPASSVIVSVTTAAAPASTDRWMAAALRDQGPAATMTGFFSCLPRKGTDNDIKPNPSHSNSS